MKFTFGVILSLFFFALNDFSALAQNPVYPLVTSDSLAQAQWVNRIYDSMSLEEKVGQLFMVDIFSSKPKKETDYIKTLIRDYHIGGVIFSKGGPMRQARLTNEYQAASKVPLLIGMDAEWGLAMRLDSTYAFPWNMTLGAIDDNSLIEKTGKHIALHAKRLGVHYDFLPSVDVNINPENPIIGNRSFGENRDRVTQKAIAIMKGMEGEGVLTSAKHFPGHGDTDVDSHHNLPVLNFSKERLDSIELYPYRKIIPEGISGVMVSHLSVPALDNQVDFPSSLSMPIVTGLLKNQMQFKGLIITDALNMNGVTNSTEPGKTSLNAFLAGNDLLLIPRSVPLGIQKIIEAYNKEIITEERLEHSVKKILMTKYKARLHNYKPVELAHLTEDLNTIEDDVLYAELMENAITLIKNNNAILPVRNLQKKKIAYVPMGSDDGTAFFEMLNKYTKVDRVSAPHLNELLEKLKPYDLVIVGHHKSNDSPWADYNFTDMETVWLAEISRLKTTVLTTFARPYALLGLRTTTNLNAIVVGYQNSKPAQEKAAQMIFGALGFKGRLPVSIGNEFPEGTRFITRPISRLTYGIPESEGMSSVQLQRIDSLANVAISKKMTPGMQVLVARNGKVVFSKNYGYQTYDKKIPINDESIYDLASLTKILATLPVVMDLEEKGKISLDTQLGSIIPFLKDSDKANITLKEALSHYGRFRSWIPFYRNTLDEKGKQLPGYFQKKKEGEFTIQVAKDFFMRRDYRDSIYLEIKDSELREKEGYKYSDLAYYLIKDYLEKYYGSNMESIVQGLYYESLGANRLGYLPLSRFPADEIVPSEKDDYWRHQELRGYVNDQGAAMFGGIGGHAGLFGNANDVAKLMQMYLNEGFYGGEQYLKKETIKAFNTCYYCEKEVRRGVGFDKPQLKGPGPVSERVPRESFGHSGFTGTIAWADPVENVLYVCLTNRTYPDPSNTKLIKEGIRTKIIDVIYDSIMVSYEEKAE